MNYRFSIPRKIALGFGLFGFVAIILFILTNRTLSDARQINRGINEVDAPSINLMERFDNEIVESYILMKQWALVQRGENDPDRIRAILICDSIIPSRIAEIKLHACEWPTEMQVHLDSIYQYTDTLLAAYAGIRRTLPTFDSYFDPLNELEVFGYFTSGEKLPLSLDICRANTRDVSTFMRHHASQEIAKMNGAFDALKWWLIILAVGLVLAALIFGYLTSSSIVRPVNSLRSKLQNLSRGIYSLHSTNAGNDEVGDMAKAVDILIANLERTKEFSLNVGSGVFDMNYEPLSEHDELGMALLRMRDDLLSYRNEMEQKVASQTDEIRTQRDAVEAQKEKITELYLDLQASIDYAQRLQQTILPSRTQISEVFKHSFVVYRPKATVSGDFYWFANKGNKKMFAAADCTGHGVPGAFMSLVGHNALNQATKVFHRPSQVLNSVNRLSAAAMRAYQDEEQLKDGMDIALCSVDVATMELEFAGAHNPAWIIRQGELIQLDADAFSIGMYVNGEREFANATFKLEEGDMIYVFSDGYADQFGGPQGKKFLRKRFRELLLEIANLSIEEQRAAIEKTFDAWKGDQEQIDDVLVMGVLIKT